MRSTECYCSSLLVEISVKVVDATSSTVKMENKVCCKSARHWLTALPWQLHRDNRWMWHRPAVVFQMPDTYRLHYQRRPAQYIISAKPARSEATWRLVCTGNKSPQLHGFSVLFCSWLRVCYRSSIQHTTRYLIYSININTVSTCLYHRNSQLCRRPCLPAVIENSAIAFPHSPVHSAVHKAIPPYSDPSIRHRDATVFSHQISC